MISVSASISKIHFLTPQSWGSTPIYNVDKTQCDEGGIEGGYEVGVSGRGPRGE